MEVWGVFWLWCIWNNSQGIGVHPWSRAYFLPFQLMSSNFLSMIFSPPFLKLFSSPNFYYLSLSNQLLLLWPINNIPAPAQEKHANLKKNDSSAAITR